MDISEEILSFVKFHQKVGCIFSVQFNKSNTIYKTFYCRAKEVIFKFKEYKTFIFNSHILMALISLIKINNVALKRNVEFYLEFYELNKEILQENKQPNEKEIVIPTKSINENLYNDLFSYCENISKKYLSINKNFERFKNLIKIVNGEVNIIIDGRKGCNPDQVIFVSKTTNYYDGVSYGRNKKNEK